MFRRFILAMYMLALVLPISVQAGFQITPTAEFQLLKDIAESRCLSSGYSGDKDHDTSDCCVLCGASQLADSVQRLFYVSVDFTHALLKPIAEQTKAPPLRLAQGLLRLRGPPLHS